MDDRETIVRLERELAGLRAELDACRATVAQQVSRAEQSARRQEARFRALAENGLDGIMLLDEQATVIYVSPAGARVLHLPPEELVGRTLIEFVHPEDTAQVERAHQDALAHPGQPQSRQFRWSLPGGAPRHLETVRVNRLDHPDLAAVVLHFRDVTDRQLLETQFNEAQKMEAIGRLAGGIAHDFNNLLSAILGTSQIVLEDVRPSDPLRQDLLQITRAAERGAALTRQLLAFSRRQVLEPQIVDVGGRVAEMQPMLSRIIGEAYTLVIDAEQELKRVVVDPGQLEQVILNLVVNARDAMPSGGTVAVEIRNVEVGRFGDGGRVPPGTYVVLSVSDTGTGIDPAIKNRIFEPFFTTKPAGKGTGLGLATVFGIVKQSGGCLTLDTELGVGTTFRIYLPSAQGKPLPKRVTRSMRAFVPSGRGETILLVEDEDAVRQVVRRVLQKHGYEVVTASNGGEALLVLAQYEGTVDLVLTDVVMPHMGGPQLVQRLLAERPELKVIFMSGHLDADETAMQAAENAVFLQKPIMPDTLAAKVRQALDEG